MTLKRLLFRGWAVAFALAAPGCLDLTGPENAPVIAFPTLTSVRIEYVQPAGCINVTSPCTDLVVFFGSWMRDGREIQLTPDGRHHIWTGVVTDVPVNYPPNGTAYEVRIYDPFLQTDRAPRYTGERLTLGGQLLTHVEFPGAHDERALVYIDQEGLGHNPF